MHFNVTLEDFLRCFDNLYKITNVTKLRDFQYRLLHKRIPTNKELKKWGIVQSANCKTCGELDNIEHTLYLCQNVKKVWQEWCEFIKENFLVTIELTFEMIVMNNFIGNPKNIINVLALILKQLIYRCKCQNTKICFAMFIKEMAQHERAEYVYAVQNNKIGFHLKKWSNHERSQYQEINEYVIAHINKM